MPPSAFLSWVQETTFAGVPLWSLLIAVLAGVATYLGILLALSLLTGRARAWASQSHSGWPVRWWMCWKAPAAS